VICVVWIRWPDPDTGDQIQEMLPAEAADFIIRQNQDKSTPIFRFGVWEASNIQLELAMATRSGILEALQEREGQTLRLVPVIVGG